MPAAEPRLQPACQRLVDQQRVEVHRHLGHAHAVALGRDAGMQVGQRLGVIEPGSVRYKALDELQHARGAVDETAQHLAAVDAALGASFVQPRFGASSVFRRR